MQQEGGGGVVVSTLLLPTQARLAEWTHALKLSVPRASLMHCDVIVLHRTVPQSDQDLLHQDS